MAGYALWLCNTLPRLSGESARGLGVARVLLMHSDDLIVSDCTWEGSLEKLARVLDRLRCAHLKLEAKKHFLFRQEVSIWDI